MIILQILLAAGIFGVAGLIFYWFGVVLKVGPKSTKDQVNKDINFR